MANKKCPHCAIGLSRDSSSKVASLLGITKGDPVHTVDGKTVIPVRTLVCSNCNYLELELASDYIN